MDPINEIAAAFAKAQLEMQNPVFDSKNPHFRSSYASLASVRNSIVPVLAKHGIAFSQDVTTGDGWVACKTMLLHSGGQSLHYGPTVFPVVKKDAHGYGAAMTYVRRYTAMAIAGVVGDVDDDANASVGNNASVSVTPISASQAESLDEQFEELGVNRAAFMKYFQVASVLDLPADKYIEALNMLENKRNAK
jgi:hypothetical protein